MRLIEDLGIHEYGTQGNKQRYGLYECPDCLKHFSCVVSQVKRGNSTRCAECGHISTAKKRGYNASECFIEKCKVVHDGKYNYSITIYTASKDFIHIICPVHGKFIQRARDHKGGKGCLECANESKSISLRQKVSSGKLTDIYYVYFPEYNLWKIGCTHQDIGRRFNADKIVIEVLYVKTYEDSRIAYFVESWILKATYSNKGNISILQSGNSELRTSQIPNILSLIDEAENNLPEDIRQFWVAY